MRKEPKLPLDILDMEVSLKSHSVAINDLLYRPEFAHQT